MHHLSENWTKFTASKSYPFTTVGKLKAIVDPGNLSLLYGVSTPELIYC